ncbi:MAG: hypothetical protein SPE90_08120 [Prevotella sp.]|nr:hypothetical protein [Prevotella sp.]
MRPFPRGGGHGKCAWVIGTLSNSFVLRNKDFQLLDEDKRAREAE